MTNNQSSIGGSFDEIRKTVKDWVVERQFRFTPSKDQGWVWGYNIEKGDFGFSVYQPSGHPEVLIIRVNADLEDYQSRVEDLSEKERMELIFDLRFKLLNLSIEFDIPNDELKVEEIYRELMTESLNKTDFWESVFQIQKGLLATVWTLERTFL